MSASETRLSGLDGFQGRDLWHWRTRTKPHGGAHAPIRSLQISISQSLLGDFCNTICQFRTHAPQQMTYRSCDDLFDHLVGEQLDGVGHLEAQRPSSLQIDDKLEFDRLQDRQIGGFRALEDLTGHDAGLTK